ncbi:MAG: N-glycosylase/DNA lyase [bacterium]|nr:N-glycosylase/DNA lyase [bacterium]
MKIEKKEVDAIIIDYQKIKGKIIKKLNEFKKKRSNFDREEIFKELCFCLLTPQSRAELCWSCIEKIDRILSDENIDIVKLENALRGVRFHKTKAKRILEANTKIDWVMNALSQSDTPEEKRQWLLKNIKGLGMKEATHFLRNIGESGTLAILDRHILRKLKKIGIIGNIPVSLSKKNYLEIEKKLQQFSKKIGIPVSHLDFVFWYQETGRIFK